MSRLTSGYLDAHGVGDALPIWTMTALPTHPPDRFWMLKSRRLDSVWHPMASMMPHRLALTHWGIPWTYGSNDKLIARRSHRLMGKTTAGTSAGGNSALSPRDPLPRRAW